MADELSTADKLAIHNQGLLVASAQKKLAAGKRLTKAEIAAVGSTERNASKKRDLPYFERMPKGEYITFFGGSSKVYIEWHLRHGFPWVPELNHVDVIAVHRWYRETFAHPPSSDANVADDARYKRARREREELRLECEKRRFVSVETAIAIFDMAAAAIRAATDAHADRAFAAMMQDRLQRAEKELKAALANGNGSAT